MKRKQRCATALLTAVLVLTTCEYPSRYTVEGENIPQHAGIDILLSSETFFVAGTLLARCVLLHTDGTRSIPEDDEIIWSSAAPAIFSVDISGLLTGISAGETELRAEARGFTASRKIIVEPPPDFSRVMISEVYCQPRNSSNEEFIEIFNGHDEEKDLSGFMLVDGSTSSKPYVFPAHTRIGPGARMMAAKNFEAFFIEFGFTPDLGPLSYALNDTSETAFLCLPDGTVLDYVYIKGGSDQFPAPESWGSTKLPSAAKGKTVARKSDIDTDTWEDWEEREPTPGW